jgi:cystathionine beta-lyase
VVNNPLKKVNATYTIDFEDFEAKAALPDTKMFLLCNPHNPTGRIFKPEELRQLAEICERHDVVIVSDEIHGDLIRLEQTFTPIAKVADTLDHIVTCTAINKTFNVAGLHCSNIIIHNLELRDKFSTAMGFQMASPFSMSALIAAYNEGQDWLDQLKVYLDGTIDWVAQFLASEMPKVKFSPPEGTYVMWLDFSEYNLSPKVVHDRIYNQANVILEDGEKFGEEGLGYQRICIPSPRPMIQEALFRIQHAFSDVN